MLATKPRPLQSLLIGRSLLDADMFYIILCKDEATPLRFSSAFGASIGS